MANKLYPHIEMSNECFLYIKTNKCKRSRCNCIPVSDSVFLLFFFQCLMKITATDKTK